MRQRNKELLQKEEAALQKFISRIQELDKISFLNGFMKTTLVENFQMNAAL